MSKALPKHRIKVPRERKVWQETREALLTSQIGGRGEEQAADDGDVGNEGRAEGEALDAGIAPEVEHHHARRDGEGDERRRGVRAADAENEAEPADKLDNRAGGEQEGGRGEAALRHHRRDVPERREMQGSRPDEQATEKKKPEVGG